MKSKESEQITPERKYISFETTELCALDAAFKNTNNREVLEEFRKDFPDTYTEGKTRFFKQTPRMELLFSKFKDFLVSMAGIIESEQKHLASEPDLVLLPCGHRVAEHRQALKSIVSKVGSFPRADQ